MCLATGINGCDEFPGLATLRKRLVEAEARGFGDEDYIALIKLLR
jgi:hypothetical protein